LVSPELSAVFSWFSRFVKGFVDCAPGVLAVVVVDPELEEEEDEGEEPSALRSAWTFARAVLAPFTSPEPNDLSSVARSVARVWLADVPSVLLSELFEAAPVEEAGAVELVEFVLLTLASSLKREFSESEDMADRLIYFPFECRFAEYPQ
jgi:hypothetical protein